MTLDYPIKRGKITNFDDLSEIWNHMFFNELRVAPEEVRVLMSDHPYAPLRDREKMAEIMFETFNITELAIEHESYMANFGTCRSCALVLQIGDGISHTLPIWEGYTMKEAILSVELSGSDITDYLTNSLREIGFPFNTTSEREIVRDMKEKLCYASLDYESEYARVSSGDDYNIIRSYSLPDSSSLRIGKERFMSTEVLFRPSELLHRDVMGIHELLHKSIMNIDIDLRTNLVRNIVLCGGSALIPGLAYRLKYEMLKMYDSNIAPNIIYFPESKYLTWLGGSALSNMSFYKGWVSREKYEEHGPWIFHKKAILQL
eukprot:TRINITY_DN1456_c0_g1_i5.p1 TRINITY_DN1456_c0_g1~~TRINITY_DN1456_c0_g1_i5.p1  ORF type:complete len:317 (-),score=34.22 TRINITY_DN1456_c0_g1_i5:186-1136(-)